MIEPERKNAGQVGFKRAGRIASRADETFIIERDPGAGQHAGPRRPISAAAFEEFGNPSEGLPPP